MSEKKQYVPMTAEEWEEKVRELATPIDFDALIRNGVLEKHGAWYKILNMNELPPHAKAQIKTLKSGGKEGTLAKFQTSTKRAEKLLKDYEARNR